MQATASIDKAEKVIFLDSERQKNQGYCSGCAALERALDKERLERQALATENKDLNFMVGKLEAQVEAMEKREERPEADNEAKSAWPSTLIEEGQNFGLQHRQDDLNKTPWRAKMPPARVASILISHAEEA